MPILVDGSIIDNFMRISDHVLTKEEFSSLKKGDAVVFRKVYEAYFGLILYVANRCGLPSAEARDVVQDTFLKLHEKAVGLQNVDGLKSWLVITAKNQALDILKRHKIQQQKLQRAHNQANEEMVVDDSNQSEWHELQVLVVRKLIEEISESTGDDSFRLFYIEGKSAKEIAQLNNEPISTVTNRISRTRLRFKDKFKRHLESLQE